MTQEPKKDIRPIFGYGGEILTVSSASSFQLGSSSLTKGRRCRKDCSILSVYSKVLVLPKVEFQKFTIELIVDFLELESPAMMIVSNVFRKFDVYSLRSERMARTKSQSFLTLINLAHIVR